VNLTDHENLADRSGDSLSSFEGATGLSEAPPGGGQQREKTSRFVVFLYLVALWTLPGLLYSFQIYQLGLRMGTPSSSFLAAMFHALPVWWFWIPLTPLLVWLARRYPIRSTGAIKEIAIHLLLSAVVAILVATVAGLWFSTTAPFTDRVRPWSAWTVDLMLSTTLHLYFWCYWLIIAAVNFLDRERRLREQEVNTARLDTLAAQARLQMLANQLQPHFLFNALNGLSTLILREDTKSAQSMLESLASFLRASLRVGDSRLVPLHDELEMIFEYLSIENVRWGDRLDLQTSIEPGTEIALVPTLLLQPLLENAIRHGIAKSETGGEISVVAKRSEDQLILQIENDGTGLSPEWKDKARNQVGLTNTRRRLGLLFQDRYDLRLDELSGGRVRLELVLPFQTDGGEAEDRMADSSHTEDSIG
jgi:signal transduction histidine kinase